MHNNQRIPALLALLALPLLNVSAQQASEKSQASDAVAGEEEIMALPEFTVKSDPMSEYLASESVTGTRVAVKIEELPFAVNVVTSEFLSDFNLLESKDQFSYVSNVGQSETQSPGYTLRGFTADTQLRNGFRRIGLIDKVNVDRVEVIKGPAASIYGAVIPGGAINIITKTPQTKPGYTLSGTVGNYGLWRAEASATGPLGKGSKLYYRFDGALYEREYKTDYRKLKQQTMALQVAYKPTKKTSLLLEAEYLTRDETANTSATIPFIVQSRALPYVPTRTYNHYVRLADESFVYTDPKTGLTYNSADLTYFNTQGPETGAERWVKSVGATLEHRFNEIFSLRAGASGFERNLQRTEVGSRDQYNPVTNKTQRGTARYRLYPEDGLSFQNDLLASFETGKIKHKLLFTIDYQHAGEQPKQYDGASNAFFPADVATGLNVSSPNYEFTTWNENPSLYGNPVSKEDNTTDTLGFFLSERATMFQDRLNIMIGVRNDTVDKHNKTTFPTVTDESNSTSETTYQLGANFKVVKGFSVFASASSSFLPQPGSGWRLTDNGTGFESFLTPNEHGTGWETGFKMSLLDEKLSVSASYFDITRKDVVLSSVTVTLADNTSQRITPINEEHTKGVDLDFSYVITPSLQLFGAYGYNDGRVEDSDVARWMIGSRLRRAPMHNAGLAAKYEFKEGSMKGLFMTAGVKYYGDSMANPGSGQSITPSQVNATNPFYNIAMPNGLLPFEQFAEGEKLTKIPYTVLVSNGREEVLNKAYTSVEAGIGYKWKTGSYSHKVQFNASNLTNVKYTYGSSAAGDPLSYSMRYEIRF